MNSKYTFSIAWLLFAFLATGCAFETEIPDAGPKDSGTGGDLPPKYPPPPYGTEYGDTVENFEVERVSCQGSTGSGRTWTLDEFLGSKAILITVHAGWCSICKQQATTMENDLSSFYDRGLNVILLLTEDPSGSTNRQKLLDYACEYRKKYGFSFPLAIDPNGAATGRYFDGVPLNMLLDREMSVRYKITGLIPDSKALEGNIEGLLNE